MSFTNSFTRLQITKQTMIGKEQDITVQVSGKLTNKNIKLKVNFRRHDIDDKVIEEDSFTFLDPIML